MGTALPYLLRAFDRDATDRDHRQLARRRDDGPQPLQSQGFAAGGRRRRINGPYNKIVGPLGPCGFGLGQVVYRPTDPPAWVQAAGSADGEAVVAKVHPVGWNGECDVETVV